MNGRTLVALALAFGCGIGVAHLPQGARAATAPVEPATIDLNAIGPDDFSAANPATPNLRSKLLAIVDTTAFYYQQGFAPKHAHAATTEVQLFLEGNGTEWLGDKQVAIKPGTVVIVPPNTPHAGLTGGPFRYYVVKTPPQDPADYHVAP
jgi:mannose-6-phosphate isomerase-like protein (cupin superfamily)